MVWKIQQTEEFAKSKSAFEKKWPAEVETLLVNLKTLTKAVELGASISGLKTLGFVRSEPMEMLAIDVTGCGKRTKPRALRLYVYVDFKVEEICVLLIGGKDKKEQSKNISDCVQYIKDRLKRHEQESRKSSKQG